MSAWEKRIELARDGWTTECRVTNTGIGNLSKTHRAVGLWAKTWFWDGRISEVSLHAQSIVSFSRGHVANEIERLSSILHEACFRARREYRDAVPLVDHDQSTSDRIALRENPEETRRLREAKRAFYPTEAIPDGVGAHGTRAHENALADAAARGLDVSDRVDPYFGSGRMIRDCQERLWGYRARLAMRSWNGVRVSFDPQEFTTRNLEEVMISELTRSSAAALNELFAEYGETGLRAGETRNGLPPGFMTLEEKAATMPAPDPAPDP